MATLAWRYGGVGIYKKCISVFNQNFNNLFGWVALIMFIRLLTTDNNNPGRFLHFVWKQLYWWRKTKSLQNHRLLKTIFVHFLAKKAREMTNVLTQNIFGKIWGCWKKVGSCAELRGTLVRAWRVSIYITLWYVHVPLEQT